MKRILMSMMIIMVVAGMIGGGVYAAFSDTETSSGNGLAAGTLDLDVDGVDSPPAMFSITNMKPGDASSDFAVLSNSGTISGTLGISLSTITNVGGSGGTEYEDGIGHLGGVATIAIYIDVDQSGTWTAGDVNLLSDLSKVTHTGTETLDYQTIDSYSGDSWTSIVTLAGSLTPPPDAVNLVIAWNIPSGAGNSIQGDSVSFSVTATLTQS